MLYEFHRNENAKKLNSVNATYVISGVQKPPESVPASGDQTKDGGDEDDIMQSSPYIPSSMPTQDAAVESTATVSIVLAREEDLDGMHYQYDVLIGFSDWYTEAKATFQTISSIHVYSLQPTVLQDLNVLTDVSREINTTYGSDDPLELGKQWGMIQNSHVKVCESTVNVNRDKLTSTAEDWASHCSTFTTGSVQEHGAG